MRKLFVVLSAVLIGGCLAGCEFRGTTADQQESAAQEQLQREAVRQVGAPRITNFTEKKLFAMTYELRDQADLPTWTYIVDLHGELHFLCKSIGYGIPYSAQFNNPEKVVQSYAQSFGSIPQAEPNGLFMPTSSSATWVIMATPQGPKPLYVEPQILVSPVDLQIQASGAKKP